VSDACAPWSDQFAEKGRERSQPRRIGGSQHRAGEQWAADCGRGSARQKSEDKEGLADRAPCCASVAGGIGRKKAQETQKGPSVTTFGLLVLLAAHVSGRLAAWELRWRDTIYYDPPRSPAWASALKLSPCRGPRACPRPLLPQPWAVLRGLPPRQSARRA